MPELEPGLLFSAGELVFLVEYGLPMPDSLGAAMQLVAHLGRYRDRKHDRPPGHQAIWKGQSKMTTATVGHLVGSKWGGGRGSEG